MNRKSDLKKSSGERAWCIVRERNEKIRIGQEIQTSAKTGLCFRVSLAGFLRQLLTEVRNVLRTVSLLFIFVSNCIKT